MFGVGYVRPRAYWVSRFAFGIVSLVGESAFESQLHLGARITLVAAAVSHLDVCEVPAKCIRSICQEERLLHSE